MGFTGVVVDFNVDDVGFIDLTLPSSFAEAGTVSAGEASSGSNFSTVGSFFSIAVDVCLSFRICACLVDLRDDFVGVS